MWDALFSQAASEGISVFVSSGDSGATGCDVGGELGPAYQFLSINADLLEFISSHMRGWDRVCGFQ